MEVEEIILEGFKVYKERTALGPLGRFTCVVGPNGTGKSVVGEAIAWALGGSKRMLRAKNMTALVNQGLRDKGKNRAQVTLKLRVTSSGSACTQPGALLYVRKTLQGSHSSIHICSSSDGSDAEQEELLWRAVTQAELQALLGEHGIQTEAVDRYIVTQSRQAVEVSDPCRLAQHLESTTLGSACDYEALIAQQEQAIVAQAEQLDGLEQEMGRLEGQREALAPMVACWKAHRREQQQLEGRKAALLVTKRDVLQQQMDRQRSQIKHAQEAQQQAAAAADAADDRAAQLQKSQEELEGRLAALRKEQSSASAKASKAAVQAAQAEAEASAAEAHAKTDSTLRGKLTSRLNSLQDQLQQLESTEGEQQEQAAALQEAHAEAAAALAALQPHGFDCNGGSNSPLGTLGMKAQTAAADAAQQEALMGQLRQQAESLAAQLAAAQQRLSEGPAATKQRLEQQLQEQLAQAAAAAEQADAAKEAVGQAEAAWREANRSHIDVQVQLQELDTTDRATPAGRAVASSAGHPASNSNTGRWAAYDSAIQHLQASGRLPGKLYGRLCNVAAVTDAAALTAVNAALQDSLNLATTLVVADRATANAVVQHFRDQRIGRVTCRILAEQPQPQQQQQQGLQQHGQQAGTPLTSLVCAAAGMPEVQPLIDSLLGGWALVEDRAAAVALVQQRPAPRQQQIGAGAPANKSLVTRQGQLFKADGEVVGSTAGPAANRSSPYNLACEVQLISSGTNGANTARAAHVSGSKEQGGQQKQQQEQEHKAQQRARQELQRRAAGADQHVHLAQQQLAAARQALAKHQEAVRTAERAAASLRRRLAALAAPAKLQQQQQMEREVQALQQRHAAAVARFQAQPAAIEAARQLASDLQAEYEAACAAAEGGRDRLRAEKAAKAAEEQLAVADAALVQTRQQLKRLRSQVASVKRELEGLGKKDLQAEGQKHKARHSELLAKEAAHKGAATAAATQAVELQSQLKSGKGQLRQAHKHAQECRASLAAAEASLKQHTEALQSCQAKHTQVLQALAALAPSSTAAATAAAAAADPSAAHATEPMQISNAEQQPSSANSDHGQAKSRRTVDDKGGGGRKSSKGNTGNASDAGSDDADDDDSDADASSSSGDFAEPPTQRRRLRSNAATGAHTSPERTKKAKWAKRSGRSKSSGGRSGVKQQRSRQGGNGHSAGNVGVGVGSKSGKRLASWMAEEAQELLDMEERLAQDKASIDDSAVEADLAALRRLQAAAAEAEAAAAAHGKAVAKAERLVDERYSRMIGALEAANKQLGIAYQFLTGGAGSAYLGYTLERRLLFSEGVALHVRPDGAPAWRPFAALSGGQQALGALALSFALQAAFPSGFYFFDEIDCALDASHAARVADYILAHQSAQYLVVSHKPQVFERASCLVGVYSLPAGGGSGAVAVHFGVGAGSGGAEGHGEATAADNEEHVGMDMD